VEKILTATPSSASAASKTFTDIAEPALHRDYLYRFAMRRIGDPVLADDLVQETFLAALQSATSKHEDLANAAVFRGRSTYRVWLAGILKHKLADLLRDRCRFVAITAEDPEREHDEMNAAMVAYGAGDPVLGPQLACERSELLAQISEALVKLPTGVADVFMAREVEGETTASIAARSGLSEANIWVRVHRARKALQAHLVACGAAETVGRQTFRWAA
jgi:RNA polymerase sigma-70 factor, ECF subfamily